MKHIALLVGVAALAACSESGAEQVTTEIPEEGEELPEGAELIECAINGAQWFARNCMVERADNEGIELLVVRHPDGGFRRFELLTDGRGLAVADGAVEAYAEPGENMIQVSVEDDRYRFPATVRANVGAE